MIRPPGPMTQPPARRVDWARVLAYRVLPGWMLLLTLTAGGLKWWDASIRGVDQTRSESIQAATNSIIAILSYRAETVEQDVAVAQQLVTNRNGLRDRLASEAANRIIPDAKARRITATTHVPAAASVAATEDRAVVLVFVDQTVTVGSEPPAEVAASYRVIMDKIDGRWLVSTINPV